MPSGPLMTTLRVYVKVFRIGPWIWSVGLLGGRWWYHVRVNYWGKTTPKGKWRDG